MVVLVTRNGASLGSGSAARCARRTSRSGSGAGMRFFAGRIDGKIAGFTSLIPRDGAAYVDNVVTLSAYRRRGIASATVTRALAEAEEQGIATVFLLAEENGDPQRLYERLGFRVVSRAMGFTRPLPPG